ncbi:MAG: helix-turn-helix domain-containing protein [Proteobacteria bacterium]|nr:helix-turn-helix domain-containing protein [Pseudomonadota bacterium]MBU1612183.1 helix-turn-helix domain-containing protein [Pseudomonadota bacterium]
MDIIFDTNSCLGPVVPDSPPLPSVEKPAFFLTDPTHAPEQIRIHGRVEVCGVRFRPGGAAAFLGFDANEFSTGYIDMDAVAPYLTTGFVNIMSGDQLVEEKMRDIQLLLARTCKRARDPDALTRHAVELLAMDHGQATVSRTSERMGISRRTLERAFGRHVGIPPKQLARIIRLRQAISLLRSNSSLSMARIAQDSGYADQAHFTREFKLMTEVTPSQFLAEHHHVAFIQYDLPSFG